MSNLTSEFPIRLRPTVLKETRRTDVREIKDNRIVCQLFEIFMSIQFGRIHLKVNRCPASSQFLHYRYGFWIFGVTFWF